MKTPPEHLSGGHVELQRWRAADAELCLRLVTESLDQLRPWMPWATSDYDLAAAQDFVQRCEADWAAGTAFNYLILAGGEPAGGAGLHARIDPGGLEIGYWVHPAYTGQGVATAAAAALTEAALALPGVDHVEIHHDERNLASERVPVKLGYTHVETRPERGSDPRLPTRASAGCGVSPGRAASTRSLHCVVGLGSCHDQRQAASAVAFPGQP